MIKKRKEYIAYILGTVLEWYDFSLFGALSIVLSSLFFPDSNHLNSLLATFGAFASGFIMRPVGGVLFGYIGDTFGRKRATIVSIFIMTISTVLIGALPTYWQCGLVAPFMLVILRMVQGLSAGGEYPGVTVILWESADKKDKTFLSSFSVSSSLLGMVAGSVVGFIFTTIFSPTTLYTWGWRLPFLLSIVLGVVGVYLRLRIEENEVFKKALQMKTLVQNPLLLLIKQYKKNLSLAIGLFAVNVVFFYTIFIYFPVYLMKFYKISMQAMLFINSTNMLLSVVLLPIAGKLSDKIGSAKVMLFSATVFVIFSYPFFVLYLSESLLFIYIGQLLLTILATLFIASVPATLVVLFPVEVQYTGVSLGMNIAAISFGGVAPLISTFLVYVTHNHLAPAFFVIFSFVIGLISTLFYKKICKIKMTT